MALSIKGIPDARYYWGIDGNVKPWALVPGTSDYPGPGTPGGYIITAAAVELVRIVGVMLAGFVQPTSAVIYYPQLTVGTAATPVGGVTQFELQYFVATTGVEAAASVNLTGSIATVLVFGY